jgi:hypothetical protein
MKKLRLYSGILLSMKKPLSLILILVVNALFIWLVLGPMGGIFEPIGARLLLFAIVTALSALALKLGWPQKGWPWLVCVAGLLCALGYQLIGGVDAGLLRYVSTYPLSLGWSEGSRYYYGSLLLSGWLYGVSVPPSILHPSRYVMQAIPFLLPDSPLWLHRLWQVLLFDGTALAAALLLAWRLRRLPGGALPYWLFTGFAFLFLFQGPVYYHLLVMVILVLWLANPRCPWQTLAVVLVASAWAGISRINWLPVPALIASVLYILETPFVSPRNTFHVPRYFAFPALWTILGTITGYLAQTAYKHLSGNPLAYFDSSFSSDLLWYRLFPSVTYAGGILVNAFVVSLPVALIVLWRFWDGWRQRSLWRWLGLGAILGMLLAGGLVVSVKIGGGSNLHNLDAYLVLLLVVGAYLYAGRFAADAPGTPGRQNPRLDGALAGFAVLVPVLFIVTAGGPLPKLDFAAAQQAIQTIQQQLDQTQGEVLFIRERQLFMFDELHNVKLVPDYEVVFLMEMAMGNNQAYLDAFQRDLANHRFALIITDPPPTQLQGRTHAFGEENDAWVERVSRPLLCTYEPVKELPGVNLVVMAPREKNDCP